MLQRHTFTKHAGPYLVKHVYYQDGTSCTLMMNSSKMWDVMRNDGRARIEFTEVYGRLGKLMNIEIYTPTGHKLIERLSMKMISRMGLDTRKIWFGTLEKHVSSLDWTAYKNRKYVAFVSFRRVPRKWVPELNALVIKD